MEDAMQREEFELRICEMLPGVSKDAMGNFTSYAEELERETEERSEDIYDAFYVELALVKRDYGVAIAKSLFDYGEQITFNYFELRGAARLAAQGWTLEQIGEYVMENGCDATPEEAMESRLALKKFQDGNPDFLDASMETMQQEMG